jgi:ThiF family protein/JAB domain-containing protein similar to deubiquitination enzymes
MNVPVTLSMTGDQHRRLREHLYPGDGKEAAALLLCGRRAGDRRHRLVTREFHPIPYAACKKRSEAEVTWSTDVIVPILDQAAKHKLSIVKVHSHPTAYAAFSSMDDEGDSRLLPSFREWVEEDVLHGSAIMLPDGQMIGRYLDADADWRSLAAINVVGDDLQFWYPDVGTASCSSFAASHAQLFGAGTTERLRRLSVAVIGCSGTGSPVIEQLVRLGVRELVIVDDDRVEERNVNRILNSTMEDAHAGRFKTHVLEAAIVRTGLETRVVSHTANLWDRDVIESVAQCDVVFGCVDTIDGRFLLNAIATYYSQAYFDIGIRLDATVDGQISEVCGTVNYLQPGRSSLISRGLFDLKDVAAAGLRRDDSEAHAQQLDDGYIRGATEQRPAVISVNMLAASLAVSEFLARLHPYREDKNSNFAAVGFSLTGMDILPHAEQDLCSLLAPKVGIGDVDPLLGMMEFVKGR